MPFPSSKCGVLWFAAAAIGTVGLCIGLLVPFESSGSSPTVRGVVSPPPSPWGSPAPLPPSPLAPLAPPAPPAPHQPTAECVDDGDVAFTGEVAHAIPNSIKLSINPGFFRLLSNDTTSTTAAECAALCHTSSKCVGYLWNQPHEVCPTPPGRRARRLYEYPDPWYGCVCLLITRDPTYPNYVDDMLLLATETLPYYALLCLSDYAFGTPPPALPLPSAPPPPPVLSTYDDDDRLRV